MTTCKHGHLQTDAEASKTSFKSTACCERNLHQNTPPPKKKKKTKVKLSLRKLLSVLRSPQLPMNRSVGLIALLDPVSTSKGTFVFRIARLSLGLQGHSTFSSLPGSDPVRPQTRHVRGPSQQPFNFWMLEQVPVFGISFRTAALCWMLETKVQSWDLGLSNAAQTMHIKTLSVG